MQSDQSIAWYVTTGSVYLLVCSPDHYNVLCWSDSALLGQIVSLITLTMAIFIKDYSENIPKHSPVLGKDLRDPSVLYVIPTESFS